MNLYIKQKVFSLKDRFRIYDENGKDMYWVEGEIFTLGKKFHLCDTNGLELAFIHQKFWSWKQRFFVSVHSTDVAEIVKEITFMKPKYTVKGPDWNVEGDFFAHKYEIMKGEQVIASISKKWLSWADTYEIIIPDNGDAVLALSVVLAIDAALASEQTATSTITINS